MPNKKISDLPAAAAAASSDLVEVEQAAVSGKETLTQTLAIGVVKTTGRVDQGIVFGVAKNASDTGLLIVIFDLDSNVGPASINIQINGVTEFSVGSTGAVEINYVTRFYVNAGDSIKINNVADPGGVNQLEDNFILPLKTST